MRLVWILALGAAACSNSSTGGPDAPGGGDALHADSPPVPIDAPDLGVRARVGQLVIGTTQTTEAIDPVHLKVVLDDGSTPQVVMTQDGTIAFRRVTPNQGYQITTGSATGATVVEDTAKSLNYMAPAFGHTLLAPVAQTTLIDVNVTPAAGAAPGGSFAILFATGQRASVSVPSPFFTAVADWRGARGTDGAPAGLLDAGQGDVLNFLHYTSPSAGHQLADEEFSMAVSQTDGSTTQMTGSATVLATQGCVRATGSVTEELARFGSNTPGASATTATFGVGSQPSVTTVGEGDIAVGLSVVAADTSVDIPYTTPFAGDGIVGTFTISGAVQHAVTNKKITTTTQEIVHVSLGTGAHGCVDTGIVTFPTGAAFPIAVTLGGVPIAADEQPVTLVPGASLTVIVTASAGPAERYTIQLVDLTTQTTLGTWVSSGSTFSIPHALFNATDTYSFTMRVDSGLPGAATGDLTSIAYPISSTTTSSYTFTTSG